MPAPGLTLQVRLIGAMNVSQAQSHAERMDHHCVFSMELGRNTFLLNHRDVE